MAENLGSYAVNLPNLFQAPGEALQGLLAKKERERERTDREAARQEELQYRRQKETEQDRLRGLSIIESGAKLDRLPPEEQASMIAQNAVANEKARLKSLLNNKVIDPIALSSNVDEAMKNITKASSTFTLEYTNADKLAEKIAQTNPSVDYIALRDDLRNDVKNRRIVDNQFVDPNNIEPSTLITEINNPENLGKYIKNYSSLNKVLESKQSTEPVKAMVGTPNEYSTYTGRTGFWSKPTFEQNQLGFITGGKAPSQSNKGIEMLNEPLPVGALKGVNKQFDMVPMNVYQRFLNEGGANTKTEIAALAQKQFPDYKNFTPQEKEFANRKALHDYVKEKDADGFALSGYNPPNMYGGGRATEAEKKAQIIGNYLNTFEGAVKSGNAADIENLANKFYGLKGGKANYAGVKIFKRPDGSVTGLQVNYTDDKGAKKVSDVISVTDANLRDKLQGIYQKISGSETSAEVANLKDLSGKNPTKFAPVIEEKINIVMKKNPGATREQIIAALKKAGKI
jgi:hypothetical protein